MKSKLMQKHGLATIELARELIYKEEGERIETVAAYAEKFGFARGTVQSAFALLKENKVIDIQSKGHLGSYITFINYKKLWEYTDFGSCMGVMPLPYSKLYEGLATGLYHVAGDSIIPFHLAYMRGASLRVQGIINERYDFAVMSKFSAIEFIKQGYEIESILDFGCRSYVNKHGLILAPHCEGLADGMKIALDKTSLDIYALTKRVCQGYDVEYVELPYNQIIENIKTGTIDAAVWSIDEILNKNVDLNYIDIDSFVNESEDTKAVIVIKKGNENIKSFLKKVIDVDKVVGIQEQVITGQLIPKY